MIQDKTTGGVLNVPCSRCLPCRVNRARMWSVRIMHEVKLWPENSFVTLTYNDENLPKNNSLCKQDCQKFIKRLRKNLYPAKIKYYLGAEYGDIGNRPHYHLIIFGLGASSQKLLNRTWGKGYVNIGNVTHDSARYVASYTLKKLYGPEGEAYYHNKGILPEFSLMSKQPAIGLDFCLKYSEFLKQENSCNVKGVKVALPRYYVEKLYNDDEKHILHSLRQEFYDEEKQKLKLKSGLTNEYEINEYSQKEAEQASKNLSARSKLKRKIN